MCSLNLFLTEADSVQVKGNIFYFISLIKQRNIPDTQEDVVNIISSYLCTTFENLWIFWRSWGHRPAPFCGEPLECPRSVDPSASQADMYIPPEVLKNVLGDPRCHSFTGNQKQVFWIFELCKKLSYMHKRAKAETQWWKHLHSKWKCGAFVVWGYGVLLILRKCHHEQDETLQHYGKKRLCWYDWLMPLRLFCQSNRYLSVNL